MNYLNIFVLIIATVILTIEVSAMPCKPCVIIRVAPSTSRIRKPASRTKCTRYAKSNLVKNYAKKFVKKYNKENGKKNKFVGVKRARKEFNGKEIHYELLVSTKKGDCSSKKKNDCLENLESDVFEIPKQPGKVILDVQKEGDCGKELKSC
uniref:Cystatin domain-containing protein n=1 Tax=Strongyloides papillosus TaxID=174720 RepID=A0A0N5BQC5_STREA